MREPDDFIRGADSPDTHLKSYAHLAWRPAWSIRSRRGALRPLIESIKDRLAGRKQG